MHVWTSHVTYMKRSCDMYQQGKSHMWTCHVITRQVTHVNMSCAVHKRPWNTYQGAMSRAWTSHVPCEQVRRKWWQTYEQVMSHKWTRHVTHAKTPRHINAKSCVSHVWTSDVCVTRMNKPSHTYERGTWHRWRDSWRDIDEELISHTRYHTRINEARHVDEELIDEELIDEELICRISTRTPKPCVSFCVGFKS